MEKFEEGCCGKTLVDPGSRSGQNLMMKIVWGASIINFLENRLIQSYLFIFLIKEQFIEKMENLAEGYRRKTLVDTGSVNGGRNLMMKYFPRGDQL